MLKISPLDVTCKKEEEGDELQEHSNEIEMNGRKKERRERGWTMDLYKVSMVFPEFYNSGQTQQNNKRTTIFDGLRDIESLRSKREKRRAKRDLSKEPKFGES